MRISKRRLLVAAIRAILIAGAASFAQAQVVEGPKLDSATLRSRLTQVRPGDSGMPADVAELDSLWAKQDLPNLVSRLKSASDPHVISQNLNWEKARIFEGAGFIMAYAYMADLWRLGSALPAPVGDQLKQSAGMMFVYGWDIVALDGVKCDDPSAPGHRHDQLIFQNAELIKYVASLPRATRMTLGTVSLAFEKATEPLRTNDDVLCGGGLAQMTAGLKAMGNMPLPKTPSAPGTVGRTVLVPTAPGFEPGFVAEAVWRPKQAALRPQMPALLTRLLTVPADGAPAQDASVEPSGPATYTRQSADHPSPPPLFVLPGARTSQLEWLRRPSDEDVRRYYPDLAQRKELEGHATIKCWIEPQGKLARCEVVEEAPLANGFAQAALAIANAGLFQIKIGGAIAVGSAVVVPIAFRLHKPPEATPGQASLPS